MAPYGTNAWAYGDVARERIVLGPGSIDQAHGTVEWVESRSWRNWRVLCQVVGTVKYPVRSSTQKFDFC